MTMAQQKENSIENKPKQRQGSLPVPIHPDDAKDKVFTAILKALFKMENKPSSPKELANIIVKHKYATLGGATPFATVSSRISQHFKRAAEHNPPRAPLLAKHVDQNHSRKINYSLATDSVSSATEEDETHEESHEEDTAKRPKRPSRKSSRSHKTQDTQEESHVTKKRKVDPSPTLRRKSLSSSSVPEFAPPEFEEEEEEEEEDSENKLADFHEEMLKSAEEELDIKRPTPRSANAGATKETLKPPFLSVPQEETTTTANTAATARKPSFSFNSGFPGEQELWTPFSFEHDFENVLIHDPSTAHHIPFNIATPESISVSELDDYFGSSPSNPSSRSHRKSFSSTMLGPNDKSLLQKVLLASAARGVADKIEEDDEEEEGGQKDVPEIKIDEPASSETEQTSSALSSQENAASVSSSSLMDVENSEDFVKFEEDEKKETPPPTTEPSVSTPPLQTAASTSAVMPTPILPAPTKRDLLPSNGAAPSAAALSASEWLKSMNIQNVNLSTLQQMSTNLQTLQQLSPTFDLAKTMAVYIQSLTKNANVNNPPTSSASTSTPNPNPVDIKSILARFPLLEAFLKKDALHKPTPAQIASPPPLPSPTTETIPNLVSASSTDPIVNTLTPTTPAMFITVIDHIAVCITVLEKTETTPEYRIMRRLDTGFINGTALLAAGGIETESERSMILSFEMDRVRMPKKKSPLFGTWIPLRRAQELAITCSVQHKLGHFLEDSIESYFPSPLPIQMTPRKPAATRDNRLTALALAALRSEKTGFPAPPITARPVAQLQELLMAHKALKPTKSESSKKKEESDEASEDGGSSHEEESDTETKHTLLAGSALQELFSRASLTHPTHIHPKDLQKKRRSSLPEIVDDSKEDEMEVDTKSNPKHARKRSGGKWSSTASSIGGGGKLASYGIKKSVSTGGSMMRRTPAGGKRMQQKKVKTEEEEVKNMVVEHKSSTHPSENHLALSKSDGNEAENEEDEDIDIGGSDFDDDLR
ncbi:hypothetical protein BY458DRAFT_535258 [Sporodiniella umbellata]|nr:hypothetical protein BY458DRAFT_535258 [Sporodiniella umbellata]